MPYIDSSRRIELEFDGRKPIKPGELNYMISRLCDSYLAMSGLTYNAGINAVIGALECAKLELYRRVAAPYEDQKMSENGEVYFTRGK